MADWLLGQLKSLGVTAEKRPIGSHKLDGKEVDLPPVIIGSIGKDPKKVCRRLHERLELLHRQSFEKGSMST